MQVMVKSHTSQGGPHSQSLTWLLQREATESIATPPGWDASPLLGYPQQYVTGNHLYLYTWVERDNVG